MFVAVLLTSLCYTYEKVTFDFKWNARLNPRGEMNTTSGFDS